MAMHISLRTRSESGGLAKEAVEDGKVRDAKHAQPTVQSAHRHCQSGDARRRLGDKPPYPAVGVQSQRMGMPRGPIGGMSGRGSRRVSGTLPARVSASISWRVLGGDLSFTTLQLGSKAAARRMRRTVFAGFMGAGWVSSLEITWGALRSNLQHTCGPLRSDVPWAPRRAFGSPAGAPCPRE